MGAPTTQFSNALRDVFGPAKTTHTDFAGAAANLIATPVATPVAGRIEVYAFDVIASAAGLGTFQLIDATATGIGGTVVWGTTSIVTYISPNLVRPLYFTKGLVQSYTATAGTLSVNVQWSPVAGS